MSKSLHDDVNAIQQMQEHNTAKLVMNTFYKVGKNDGTTANDIARYLQDKFGEVWQVSALKRKADETLKRSVAMGFLDRRGDKYISKLTREVGCRKRRRRRSRRRRCGRRRRRRSCRRRRRRKSSCCCG